jgi:hypothetical protein
MSDVPDGELELPFLVVPNASFIFQVSSTTKTKGGDQESSKSCGGRRRCQTTSHFEPTQTGHAKVYDNTNDNNDHNHNKEETVAQEINTQIQSTHH